MRSSRAKAPPSPAAGRKRRKPGASGHRTRKKQKRLDAIRDRPETTLGSPSPLAAAAAGEASAEAEDPAQLRRSSRVRKAPVILDSSPVPSPKKGGKKGKRRAQASGGTRGRRSGRERSDVASVDSKVKKELVFEEERVKTDAAKGLSEEEASDWSSRLRSRARKGSAVGKRKRSYRRSDKLFGKDKDSSKPKKEVTGNVDLTALESGTKERRRRKKRRRRKVKDRDGASLLLKNRKEKGILDKDLGEEVIAVFSSNDNDGEKNIPGDEGRVADGASLDDECKIVGEKAFSEATSKATCEIGSSLDESKSAATEGIPEDIKVTDENVLSKGNDKIANKEALLQDESKIAARGDMLEDGRVTGEEVLSEGQNEIIHEDGSLHAESKISYREDVREDGGVKNVKAFSENGSKIDTLKALSNHGCKTSPDQVSKKDKDKTTERTLLEEDSRTVTDKDYADGKSEAAVNSVLDREHEHDIGLTATDQTYKEQEVKCADENGGNSGYAVRDNMVNFPCQSENGFADPYAERQTDKLETGGSERRNIRQQENSLWTHQDVALDRPRVREGRRCGLCGGGSDGKPPKKLILESDSDHEQYNGSSSSEEPNYDLWDGFGDEPEWLGRLLGPIRDRFGIARVWVHQQCAVWSPEVYFAGLGHLKSVRAALYRGRALKCSRCGRPGATIGCRVDRCPKTYHLPCARAENCIFDHHKFLIACTDHRHIFQPQGNHYLNQLKKRKTRKMRLDMRKLSNEALRKDLEAEEKWLENCGEDEEFLKREGKRLHRDMLRVTPVYIGGSCSEKEKFYQGWETVAGLQDVIQCMKEVIILPLLYPQLFSSLGLTPPRGVLLHGYPGTGKTLVVRALIGECSRGDKRIAYFARKGADCLGKYVGDAERQLRLLFQVAERCQPSIIFFDEIDGLAPCRSKQQDQTHNSVVSTLLSLLDGLKSRGSVVVIGATNRPDAVDPALRRPGRFDREIYFPLPSVKDRSAILSLQTKNWPKPLSGRVLSWIANQTAGYAGADLQALCTQAAMIALKRNCPLHEILTSAERGSNSIRQPSLPSFTVEEIDWLAALACAPPPCSRREAGMAANGVVTAPLPTHLIPCLLQPLSHILMSFYFDERIWMPAALFKASRSIKNVICSALQQMGLPILSWKSNLGPLVTKLDVAKEIERNLSCFGLLDSASTLGPPCTFDKDNCDEDDKSYSHRLQIPPSCIHNFTRPNIFSGLEKSSGFRVLIAGTPRSGQQHLAACLLHQFLGHIEIQKVNLATISQEGRGDIIRGITQILLKCVSMGQCVVFMPRLDLWAVEETLRRDIEENTCQKTCKSPQGEGLHDDVKHSSRAWSSFVEQLDSMSRSSSLIVLATCEMTHHDLPVRIRDFFTTNVLKSTDSASLEHTIPRFFVQVDGNFKHHLVISSSVARISRDLVQYYVQLIHQRSHVSKVHEEPNVHGNTKIIQERIAPVVGEREAVDKVCTTVDSERILSDHGALRDVHAQQLVNVNKRQNHISLVNREGNIPLQCHQDSLFRVPANKVSKGNSVFMIATLGYQILQYPQFAELCWVTSKLKEGPCADINGPWTVWPFNSCIIHANNSTDETYPLNSSNVKDKENSGVVRGLIAVGLLAYRGIYTSVREVSFEVRKVLELLVRLISVKIQNGKDRCCFLRLLSQVAYLEDMVNSWAYTFQSLQVDSRSQISGSNRRLVSFGEMNETNNANDCKLLANDASLANSCEKSCDTLQEMIQRKSCESLAAQNGEYNNQSNYIAPESEAPRDILSSASSLLGSCPDPSDALPRRGETYRSEHPASCSFTCKGDEGLPKSQTSLPMTVSNPFAASLHNVGQAVPLNCGSRDVHDQYNGLEAVNPSNCVRLTAGEQVGAAEYVQGIRNDNFLSFAETICLYGVCADCLQSLHVLTREMLTNCLESSGHSPTLDDVHDIVTSCSLNLVAAVRKHFLSQTFTESEEHCSRGPHGSPTENYISEHIDGIKLKEMSHSPRCFEHMNFLPNECSEHLGDKESFSTEKNACNTSMVRPTLKILFRDGILLPSSAPEGVVLHCNFEKLCLRPILDIISLIKQP